MRRRRAVSSSASTAATAARKSFVIRKQLMLSTFAGDLRSAKHLLVQLERLYDRQQRDYFLRPNATVGAWETHGPLSELDEVRTAVKGVLAFDTLVKRYAKRDRD